MPKTENRPVDLAARLQARVAARTRTILIVDGDICREVQVGFARIDALDEIWNDDRGRPTQILEVDFTSSPSIADVTVEFAQQLEARAISERRTPQHLMPLLTRCGLLGFVEGARRDIGPAQRLGGARRLGVVR